jgi:hypothetical protein
MKRRLERIEESIARYIAQLEPAVPVEARRGVHRAPDWGPFD